MYGNCPNRVFPIAVTFKHQYALFCLFFEMELIFKYKDYFRYRKINEALNSKSLNELKSSINKLTIYVSIHKFNHIPINQSPTSTKPFILQFKLKKKLNTRPRFSLDQHLH